jgi:hypothetical protein
VQSNYYVKIKSFNPQSPSLRELCDMPLPEPTAPRRRLHLRRISLDGFKREDGLWDIEARLTDTKDHDYPLSSGLRLAGEAVHDMWVRVTIDGQFNIKEAVASADSVPYPGGCDTIAPDYSRLAGLNLARGFRRKVGEMFETVRGCSHITELLHSLPTAALQTFASEMVDTEGFGGKPFQLDRCHALDTMSDTVRQFYPKWYRGTGTG